MKKGYKLGISIAIPFLVSGLGSIFTSSSVNDWYKTINKPSFNPPSWVFGPVWTILFLFMGISFFLVWIKNFGGKKKLTVGIYYTQLILNLLWSILFFGLMSPLLALIDIILLIIAIGFNIKIFYPISKKAAYLLIPYLLWVIFASILNLSIFILN